MQPAERNNIVLNRQKAIVYILERVSHPVTRIELTKWCFLLRQETQSHGGKSFYEFLPYLFGPFSFCLSREVQSLARDGFIEEINNKTWQVAPNVKITGEPLPKTFRNDIELTVRRFSDRSPKALLNYVYQSFPWFTINSRLEKLETRPVATLGVYTAGYEGLSVDGFLNILLHNGIERIIDVRNNPVARRYGFHKSTLAKLAGCIGIEYIHIPELGIESRFRRNLDTWTDYQALLCRYEAETLPCQGAAIDRVSTLMRSKASVLVCMEADPVRCHRSRLAKAVADRMGLTVRHLERGE